MHIHAHGVMHIQFVICYICKAIILLLASNYRKTTICKYRVATTLQLHCINFMLHSTLCTSLGDLLKTVVSLYMKDSNLPLPSSAEVCICTSTTTAEEVTF